MSRTWHKVVLSLGISFLVFALFAWFFGFQTLMVLETRWVATKFPAVNLTPQALPSTDASTAEGELLSYSGYQFEVPWADRDEAKTASYGNRMVLCFRSGRHMMISTSAPGSLIKKLVDTTSERSFRQIYGDEPLKSDYAMLSLIVNATPNKVTVFGSREDAVRVPLLLVMKGVAAPEDSGLYVVQTKDFKGFQWGDPEKHPKRIVVELFADDGRMDFSFWPSEGEQEVHISQSEINRVLQTLHKSSEIQPDSPPTATSVTPEAPAPLSVSARPR